MRNFNTNQTRFLYVAGAIDSSLDTKLDIAIGQTATGELYFQYVNNDGILTRSDTIDPKKIVCLKKTAAADMATPLLAHTITLKTANYADLAAVKGKTLCLTVLVHQVFDYDDSNVMPFTIAYTVPSGESSLTTLYGHLKAELDKTGLDKFGTITSSSSGLVITEKQQKYVLGKLTGEPVHFSVSFDVAGDNEPEWGADAVAASGSTISGSFALADLEYFCAGEKGDFYRGFNFPNDYPFNPAINTSTSYDVLSIEYYWAGGAENVQKSPRLIQIAGKTADINSLYTSVDNAMKRDSISS